MTLNEAFCTDERYTRASWINVIMIMFHELTGINVVLMYSSTILENILGTGSSGFNARQGSYMVAFVNLFSSFTSIFAVKYFGRRTLLLLGHSGIFVAYMLMGWFVIIDFNYGVLVMICVFLFVY